ncbi:MAG: PglL family O-oligosaccharyltransferase [Polaromonas sp.]
MALVSHKSPVNCLASQTLNVRLSNAWLAVLLVLPWLSPYTAGPTPNAWPWLISAFCAILLWLLRRRLNVKLITATWVLAAGFSAMIGLLQYFGLAQALDPWVSQTVPGEAFANLRQRNQFATLTSIGLIALLAWVALVAPSGASRISATRVPWWASATAVLLALGNAASDSRTGLLQWALVLALTAWCAASGRRHLRVLALQAMLAYAVAVLALPWLLELVTGVRSGGLIARLAEAPGCASRRVLWSNVLTLIAQKPWLGWGWGELDYAHFMTQYAGPRFCEILDNAHNLPLHLAVELGLPAALTASAAAGWMVWRAKPWRESSPARQMAWGVLAVIMLHSMVEYPLWYGPFQIAFALSVGLLWSGAAGSAAGAASARGHPPKIKQNRAAAHYLRVFIAISLIALWVLSAIDYQRVSQIYLPAAERSAAYRDDTLNKIRGAWLFRDQARFAELSVTALTPDNAAALYAMAQDLLHYSPEPRVIEKLIESAVMLGRDDEALLYLARYRAAFPQDHARWALKNAK